MNTFDIATAIAKNCGGKIWEKKEGDVVAETRVYTRRGYAHIDSEGRVNLNWAGRDDYEIAQFCKTIGIETYSRRHKY